jgi:uncharacterized protein YjiS (DUF1127 family)
MEAAMTDTRILATAPHRAAWLEASRRRHGLATLRGMIATWRERIRLRRHLAQMARANPHLIADIGLTRRQLEAEIAKPFWRD